MRSSQPSRIDDDSARVGRGLTFAGPSSRSLPPSLQSTSRRMAKTRRSNTTPELELRRELHRRGLRFRVDRPLLPDKRRRADIVFGPSRVAVFVDGCFWHGCPQHATWPATNEEFWREKIRANQLRDMDTNAQLESSNWLVIRVWEHEDPIDAASRVEREVMRRREG